MAGSPRLSIIVNFHNMRREAARTLHTLGVGYQRDVDADDYEVIAIDNGSEIPIDPADVAAFQGHLRYLPVAKTGVSPCPAINRAVASARGGYVMVCIDGARMVSPGLVSRALTALSLYRHPFVYTLGMHLGPKPQNELVEDGYDQRVEDALLETVDWRTDGYQLFSISSVAYSSRKGFFSRLAESNCFALRMEDYLGLGGLDERFEGPGGGLVNLDFFNIAHQSERIQPVMLLGEASFHQFHGGVATNVKRIDHPWPVMAQEYQRIRGRKFTNVYRPPEYFGSLSADYHQGLVVLS